MPRADEPRVPVRLSHADYAVIEAAAKTANVAVAALMRECAVRHAASVARQIMAGEVTGLRRQRIEAAEAAAPVVRASSLRREDDSGWARQQRVNALGKSKPKPAARGGRSS